ncbi:PASTA domain-containing protein [Dactylosporangium sp. NPDC000555]|uniref:PASTA domain-containing protein n=1 Tax=Dactylosporangium sp. NPDC000555 TaxID=3154260 RepID=UPI003328D288
MANSPDRSPDDESSTQPFWPFGEGGEPERERHEGTDATQVHRPSDDTTHAHRQSDEATQVSMQVHRPSDDATQVHRPSDDATQVSGPPDATRVGRPSEATRAYRAQDATRVERPAGRDEHAGARWSARAGVPVPGDPSLRRPAPQEWVGEEEDPYQGRSWFSPVIVGIIAVVLVGALSVGLYLIYRATESGQNAPGGVDPTSATTAAAPPAPSSAPPESSAVPASEAPATSSAAPPAGQVVIPPLRGDTLAEATVKLQVLGLDVVVQRRADDSLPPGEVLSARPGEGETVTAGDTVTLIVAAAPVSPPPPSPSPSKPQPSTSASG